MVTVWRLGKTKVIRLLGIDHPATSIRHESTGPTNQTPPMPAPTLPHEVVEMIIAHLPRGTLKACSLTCRSWYIATAPYLHHTFTFTAGRPGLPRSQLGPLSKLHELGLMSLMKEIRVKQGDGPGSWFVPEAFTYLDLRYFSAFTNVHTLALENAQIRRFVPDNGRYFEHFSPTLRSIALYNPDCTPRQLSHFLSFFPNLDDINLDHIDIHIDTLADTNLVSFPTPKLGGGS